MRRRKAGDTWQKVSSKLGKKNKTKFSYVFSDFFRYFKKRGKQ